MSKGAINFSSDNEYYTPKYIVDYFGTFDYDPATTKEKAEELNIKNYDTKETNGLNSDWSKYKRIWINPPFTEKHKFLAKAFETYKVNPNIDIYIYILFPLEFLTSKRFHDVATGGKIYLPKRRIKFESGIGKKSETPAFGSVIMKLQDKWEIEILEKEI